MPTDREVLVELASRLPGGGERRDGQLEMCDAVERAVATERHLVVQAGTGTGKSLAYLVPVIRSGAKTVVATATKALQDQIAEVDVPFLSEHLDEPVVVTVLKGRSNYLCRQRLVELDRLGADHDDPAVRDALGGPAPTSTLGREVAALAEWATSTRTGDRAELEREPSPRAWASVSVTAEECPGAHRCPSGDDCFAEDARLAASASQVVIVNQHLYATHLASGGNVLDAHDVLVVDEAHQLEDVVAASLGLSLTSARIVAVARAARAVTEDTSAADDLEASASRLADELVGLVDRRLDAELPDGLAGALELCRSRAEAVIAGLTDRRDDAEEAPRLRARSAIDGLRADIDVVVSLPDTHTAWVEGPATRATLRAAAVDVAGRLAADAWPHVTSVLTSATIPPGTPARLGLPAPHDVIDVGSPFDYQRQGLLYCAAHLPAAGRPGRDAAVVAELARLIEAAGGRTLALFTSWRAMTDAVTELRSQVSTPILAQGELAKPALVDRFSSDESASLFATMSFWQGVDVPGRTLSLVTIDKIPFPRPDDPLLSARRERARGRGFAEVDLPRAATLLAQGAGRLIRSAEDRGVVGVLDPRLATASYRWDLVRALPPLRRTRDPDEVTALLRSLA